jgi:hypothetical protein
MAASSARGYLGGMTLWTFTTVHLDHHPISVGPAIFVFGMSFSALAVWLRRRIRSMPKDRPREEAS